jgi:chemotaxis methyl-accepting protein methylase
MTYAYSTFDAMVSGPAPVAVFFDEPAQLQALREACASWTAQGRQAVRVCCLSLEPYTLAMVLAEALEPHGISWTLIVSSRCDVSLLTAAQGVYERSSLESVPELLRQRYFEPEYCDDFGRRTRRVVPELRAHLRFERALAGAPPSALRAGLDALVFADGLVVSAESGGQP